MKSVLLPILLWAGVAAASGEPASEPDREVLRDHVFLHPTLQDTAMIGTHVAISEGALLTNIDALPVGVLGTRDVRMVGFRQTIELAIGFTDWLGLHVDGIGNVVTGRDLESLLFKVGSFGAEGEVSLALRLLRSEATGTQLTFRANGGLTTGREFSVQPLIESLVETPVSSVQAVIDRNLGELLQVPVNEQTLGVGLHLAQTVTRGLAFQASFTADRTWRTEAPFDVVEVARVERRSRSVRGRAALALTYDFNAHRVPVALLGEYLFTFGDRNGITYLAEETREQTASLGLYYTGQRHLQLGITAAARLRSQPQLGFDDQGELRPSEQPDVGLARLTMRYLW